MLFKSITKISKNTRPFGSTGAKSLNIFSKTAESKLPEKYDAIVLGGGSAGISFARKAKSEGLSVALLNKVTPTIHGTVWGLGGTCVNVGCIPKKLMYNSGQIKDYLNKCKEYGWEGINSDSVTHNWTKLTDRINKYIKSLNFEYQGQLIGSGINYFNVEGRLGLDDPHTILTDDGKELYGENIIIAVGGRPIEWSGEGAENWITSDDLFSLKDPPGRTLVVGGGYIGVECSSFLNKMGFPVTLLTRDIFLRNFDRDMSNAIIECMQKNGVVTCPNGKITSIQKMPSGAYQVSFTTKNTTKTGEYDTLLLAIGRKANTQALNLPTHKVETSTSGQIIGYPHERERSISHPHIYTLGDSMYLSPQLMPTARLSGELLGARLGKRKEAGCTHVDPECKCTKDLQMRWEVVPTSVFAGGEYACVGVGEEVALEGGGGGGGVEVEVYHSRFNCLGDSLNFGGRGVCPVYIKMICTKDIDEIVLGLHYHGPNAAEIISSFSLAMSLDHKLRKRDFDRTLGIHPTISEEFMKLKVTKREQPDYMKTDC